MGFWPRRCAFPVLLLLLPGLLAGPAAAQGMMQHVDLASPRMSEAEMTREDVEALLAEASPDHPADLADKSLNGLDLSGLDGPSSKSVLSALNATGIDDALDALDLTKGNNDKIDRHPERRFKAAYTAFETRRLDEMKDEKGLRRQQKIDQIRKEFEKHPDNPFNQVQGTYNMSKDEMAELRESERQKLENRLGA